jgi:hypothetical protein
MSGIHSSKFGRFMLVGVFAFAGPLALAQAGSPLGFELPPPGSSAGAAAARWDAPAGPTGISPLGFELPVATPRGALGPVRTDAMDAAPADQDLRRALGGIGGSDTP